MQRFRTRAFREPALLAFIIFSFFGLTQMMGGVAASKCQAGTSSISPVSEHGDPNSNSAPPPQVRNPQEQRPTEQEQEMERKRDIARKKQYYEETKKLTEQLLRTVQDLKNSIDKAGENTLPLDALRKTEEIESLAKKIKSRLKNAG